MILTGKKIIDEVLNGNIIIKPFREDCITTNSYDISLSNELLRYTTDCLDPKQKPTYERFEIPTSGYILEKGKFYLGASNEIIGSTKYVPILHAKSGIARMGLFVHVTADLIDIGSIGNITFQLFPTIPVKVYPYQKIGQMTFWKPFGEISLYSGKYQNSVGPQVSKTYMDYSE